MILESVEHGLLIWPMVEENGVIRTKKYAELSTVAYQSPQAPTQLITESPFIDSSFFVPVFSPGDDPIACLNKEMAFLIAVVSSRFPSTNNQLRTSSNTRNQATIQDGRVTVQQVQGRQGQNYSGTYYKGNATSLRGNTTSGHARVVKCYNYQGETEDLDTYNSDCDDLSNAQAILMANISNYCSDVISEVPNFDNYLNDMDNQKESRSKMSEKEKDPEVIANKISHKPIDYEKLNRLTDDFAKRFTPQQELSAEQAFWLRISNPTIESFLPPVRLEIPSELPKVSLVNESLKNLKFQLAQFDSVVKNMTIPNALTESE
uniref:Uncharacterized protein n=1 Tax=Tanacetum cinerariifolium TaxID=118510 RepID=A0A699ILG7_TANCI|nr:hypothetical protein [Tanacetum cinerariifolium]